jgi:hypothetical protein
MNTLHFARASHRHIMWAFQEEDENLERAAENLRQVEYHIDRERRIRQARSLLLWRQALAFCVHQQLCVSLFAYLTYLHCEFCF